MHDCLLFSDVENVVFLALRLLQDISPVQPATLLSCREPRARRLCQLRLSEFNGNRTKQQPY